MDQQPDGPGHELSPVDSGERVATDTADMGRQDLPGRMDAHSDNCTVAEPVRSKLLRFIEIPKTGRSVYRSFGALASR